MTRRESQRAVAGLTLVAAVSALTLTAIDASATPTGLDNLTGRLLPLPPDAAVAIERAVATRAVGRAAERIARVEADAEVARREAERLAAIEAARAAEQARREAEARAAAEAAAEERARVEAARKVEVAQGTTSADVVRPATGRITSPFGMRVHPITGVFKLHDGTDFARGDGNAYAAMAGVAHVSHPAWAGTLVTVDHGSVQTTYGHLARATVSDGQRVSAGEVVGRIGSAGYSTGPHLHFQVIKHGQFTDPIEWLRSQS